MTQLAKEGVTIIYATHEMGFAPKVSIRTILWMKEKLLKIEKQIISLINLKIFINLLSTFYKKLL